MRTYTRYHTLSHVHTGHVFRQISKFFSIIECRDTGTSIQEHGVASLGIMRFQLRYLPPQMGIRSRSTKAPTWPAQPGGGAGTRKKTKEGVSFSIPTATNLQPKHDQAAPPSAVELRIILPSLAPGCCALSDAWLGLKARVRSSVLGKSLARVASTATRAPCHSGKP